MTWIIAKKEIVSNLLSYKFFIVILLMVIMVFTSFFIMHRDFKERLSDYHLIKPGPEDPIAVNPPNPLSIFVKGLDEAMARSYEVTLIGIDVKAGKQSGNIIFSYFSAPDFMYLTRVILSLVALLFGFDQISREREAGTLKLMLSNPVSRAKVLIGKWTGNFLCLAVPFIFVTLIGFSFMNLDPGVSFGSFGIVRFGLILLVSLIYISLFLSLGILISAFTKRTATSIVILLFIWAIMVFIIPNVGTLVARQIAEVPSVRGLSEKRDQIWTREILLGMQDRNWSEHYNRVSQENDMLEEDYRNKFNRLVGLSKNINRISPVASYIYAVSDIAGTGIGEEGSLKREVIRYKNQIFPDVIEQKEKYPNFSYRYRSLSQVFAGGALFDTAWLLFFNIFFFALSYAAMVRYDVR
ncbi:MAG: ABC transporter permease [Candidatus Aminicenantes bacterium]|nr:ABC transporter permease [Candidatus Aminicenantes bacterium]